MSADSGSDPNAAGNCADSVSMSFQRESYARALNGVLLAVWVSGQARRADVVGWFCGLGKDLWAAGLEGLPTESGKCDIGCRLFGKFGCFN